jgi:uncharacterized protein
MESHYPPRSVPASERELITPPAAEPYAVEAQYSLTRILLIWAAAALPMAVLGWVVAPAVGDSLDLGVGDANRESFARGFLLLLGLVWQFVLVLILVRRDEGELSWTSLKRRCWLNPPRDPQTGTSRRRLWLWLVPFILGGALVEFLPIQSVWNAVFPFLGEPDRYSFARLLESDARKEALVGAWHVLAFFVVLGIFNTVIGEELLFRGILLPKMGGVFGKRDWIANGVLFGLYHLHQPWTILSSMAGGVFFYAYPSRRFRSAWMGIGVHSANAVFFVVIALGLVLGRV